MTAESSMQAITFTFHRAAAFTASLDVDIEHTFQALRPAHRCPSLGGGLLLALVSNVYRKGLTIRGYS
jgi:hypothetical protein